VGDEDSKGKRTEVITREYGTDGELVTETVTVKTVLTPKADAQPEPGGYL
jgi:hypothetical protein